MTTDNGRTVSLKFPLDIQDEWPPVAVECLPFRVSPEGYTALASPLFVKDLSVGDCIAAKMGDDNSVEWWSHVARSGRTTIWLVSLSRPDSIDIVLAKLRALGCNTVTLAEAGCFSVDVPETVSIHAVDAALGGLDVESAAVAFPSMRHSDAR